MSQPDFYREMAAVDRLVHKGQPSGPGVDQREELQKHLNRVGMAARRLLDDRRSYPPSDPPVLYDGVEGEWEEIAYVPVAIARSRHAARWAIPHAAAEFVIDEPGLALCCEGRGVFMAPSLYVHGDEDWRWSPCPADAAGAVEFWRVAIVERRLAPRRALGSFRGALRHYRHLRKQGKGRWDSLYRLRRVLTAEFVRNWRWRRKINKGERTSTARRPRGHVLGGFWREVLREVEAISDDLERHFNAIANAIAGGGR